MNIFFAEDLSSGSFVMNKEESRHCIKVLRLKKGDQVLFYHSNEGLAIVGIAEIVKEAYQDPTTEDTNWVVVELKPVKALPKPVTLADIKADASLATMELVRLSRLSVSAVTAEEFKKVLRMGGVS